ncbi:GNAT family acetyltransferase [Staphylococcus agnetis]|nr:GNAT family acetyltransferase [Staphylococcus agnetis]
MNVVWHSMKKEGFEIIRTYEREMYEETMHLALMKKTLTT